jgi:flagella basal body P-ring formation protein FlgA
MNDMEALDRLIAMEVTRASAPPRPVDDAAVFAAITVTQFPRWRFQSMFSAAKFAAAGALVALFGGFLLAGALPPSPDRAAVPAALATGEPASSADPSPSAPSDSTTDVVEPLREVYEATARLIVDPGPDPSVQDIALAERALVRYAATVASRGVVDGVIAQLGLDESPETLLDRISTSTDEYTLELAISARDEDPEAARLLAMTLGDEMRARVRELLITDEVKAADAAIAANRQSIRRLQSRLDALSRKNNKTKQDRSEIIALAGQISALQRDIQFYQPSSRAFVRNRLDWFERPITPRSPVEPGARQEAVIPTIDVVVAARRIEQGTIIESEMLSVRSIPTDLTNEMALTDRASAVGRVAAIDILPFQPISPNMLVAD